MCARVSLWRSSLVVQFADILVVVLSFNVLLAIERSAFVLPSRVCSLSVSSVVPVVAPRSVWIVFVSVPGAPCLQFASAFRVCVCLFSCVDETGWHCRCVDLLPSVAVVLRGVTYCALQGCCLCVAHAELPSLVSRGLFGKSFGGAVACFLLFRCDFGHDEFVIFPHAVHGRSVTSGTHCCRRTHSVRCLCASTDGSSPSSIFVAFVSDRTLHYLDFHCRGCACVVLTLNGCTGRI